MRLIRFLLSVGIVVSMSIVVAVSVWADDEQGIEVVEQKVESLFPDGVNFSVTVRSPDEIDEIRVFFRKADDRTSAYGAVEFEPGTEVTGEYLMRTGGSGSFFPAGTEFEYSIEVRDKAGRVYRTEDQEFLYLDNRFEWRTVSDGLISVYYYGDFVEKRAQTILKAAQDTLVRMTPVLGVEPTEPLRIVSYNNYRHMVEALPFRSQAVRERLQTEGMAFSEERVLLVLGFSPSIQGIASHEFVHLLVHLAAGRANSQVPAWLNEGLAEYGNMDPTDTYEAALRYAIFTRRLKPLWYQSNFGGNPDDILIGYGQGASVVNYLIVRYGQEKIAELMSVLQETLDIDGALEQTYGFDQYGLDTEWRLAIGLEPLPSPEELERRVEAGAEATPTSLPTPTPKPGPTTAVSVEDEGEKKSSPGCGVFPGQVATDLAMLLLLGGPLAMLSVRALRRRWPW